MDDFTHQYAVTAIWVDIPDDVRNDAGEPIETGLSEIAPWTLAQMVIDCAQFQADNEEWLEETDLSQAGHNFWLTHNHRARFLDGDYAADVGTALTEALDDYPSLNLYVGDDGMIHAI